MKSKLVRDLYPERHDVVVGYRVYDKIVVLKLATYDDYFHGFSSTTECPILKESFTDVCGMTFEHFEEIYRDKIFLHEVTTIGELLVFGDVNVMLFERLKAFWG